MNTLKETPKTSKNAELHKNPYNEDKEFLHNDGEVNAVHNKKCHRDCCGSCKWFSPQGTLDNQDLVAYCIHPDYRYPSRTEFSDVCDCFEYDENAFHVLTHAFIAKLMNDGYVKTGKICTEQGWEGMVQIWVYQTEKEFDLEIAKKYCPENLEVFGVRQANMVDSYGEITIIEIKAKTPYRRTDNWNCMICKYLVNNPCPDECKFGKSQFCWLFRNLKNPSSHDLAEEFVASKGYLDMH